MDFNETKFWKWWSVYGIHIQGILIIVLFILILFAYSKNNSLQEEISNNCGWGEEDYYCYCEKDKALEFKNKINIQGLKEINLSKGEIGNVSLDG